MLEQLQNRAILDRLEQARAKSKIKQVDWPDRHIIGKDGKPVPFHLAQSAAYDSNRRTIVMSAGSQSGKTTLQPWWLRREIQQCGTGDYLAVTSSFDVFKLKYLPQMLLVFEDILGWGRFWAGDKIIELKDPKTGEYWAEKSTDPMWGRIILRSAQSLGGLESATAKAASLDEAGQDEFPIEAYRAINRRLSLNRGRKFISTTIYNLGWLKCVVGETLTIIEGGGRKRVSDIEIGNRIASLTSFGKVEYRDVVGKVACGIRNTYLLKTQTGRELICTANHKFLTGNGWGELKDLDIGTRIAVPRRLPSGSVNEPRARMLGWLIGDGSLTNKHCVKISIGEEESRQDFESSIPADVTLQKYYGKYEYGLRAIWPRNKTRPNPVTKWLAEIGIMGCGAYDKHIPACCWEWDKESISELLGGLFSSDGTASCRKISFCSVSKRLALDVQELLMRLGINSNIIFSRTNSSYHVRITHIRSKQLFLEKVNLIPRKQNAVRIIAAPTNQTKTHAGKNDRVPYADTWMSREILGVDDDIYWDKISEITQVGDNGVYDIQVDGTENFIANCIFAHNSELIDPVIKTGTTRTETLPNSAEIDITESEKEDCTLVQYDSIVNPEFSIEEWNDAKAKLPDDLFNMFYRGRISRPRHMIYDCLDEDIHFMPRFAISNDWQRYVGLDFGAVNTVATFWAEHPESKKLYCYKEYKHGGRSAKEHVEAMLESESHLPLVWGGAKAEGQWRQEFRDGGLSVKLPKIADVWLGINIVYSQIKQNNLFFFDDLPGVENDMLTYRRKYDNTGNPTDDIYNKNAYHFADTVRYLIPSIRSSRIALLEFA